MKTIRQLIEGFVYEHLERMTRLAYEGGEDSVLCGIRCFDDPEKFVQGAAVDNAIHLYLYTKKQGEEEKAAQVLKRLLRFLDMASAQDMKTWGKLAVLRGFCRLRDADCLDVISEAVIETMKQKTDYGDFFDKETMSLRGYPTNYLQVAMACAGYREKLGWEADGMSRKIAQKLMESMNAFSGLGWMDENPPYGRFDRYSIMIASELADSLYAVGMELPETVRRNLRDSAEAMLALMNEKGDGIAYGRSLSVHGDASGPEVFSTALAHGVLPPEKLQPALWYSIKSLERLIDFWYDQKIEAFNIWFDGRTTNAYRQKARILEVNLDMANHLINTLHNFERAGAADILPDYRYEQPETWQCEEICFEKKNRSLFVLKRGTYMFQLPIIGAGNLFHWTAYLPFPAQAQWIESPPEFELPFLVPKIIFSDGCEAMPIQYFSDIGVKKGPDKVIITTVTDGLCGMAGQLPEKLAGTCKAVYTFAGNRISVRFEIDTQVEVREIQMGFAGKSGFMPQPAGMEPLLEKAVADDRAYDTPHGALEKYILWHTSENHAVGYDFIL